MPAPIRTFRRQQQIEGWSQSRLKIKNLFARGVDRSPMCRRTAPAAHDSGACWGIACPVPSVPPPEADISFQTMPSQAWGFSSANFSIEDVGFGEHKPYPHSHCENPTGSMDAGVFAHKRLFFTTVADTGQPWIAARWHEVNHCFRSLSPSVPVPSPLCRFNREIHSSRKSCTFSLAFGITDA